jgi:hypothetical protein
MVMAWILGVIGLPHNNGQEGPRHAAIAGNIYQKYGVMSILALLYIIY